MASALGRFHRMPLPLRRDGTVLHLASVGPLPMSNPAATKRG